MFEAVITQYSDVREPLGREMDLKGGEKAFRSIEDPLMFRPSDFEMVTRSQSGDLDAFSELIRRHERMVFNLAHRFTRDWFSAEDMAQESFLKAFRLLKGFRGDCSFATWLYRVTCSVCLTEIAKRKRRNEVELTPSHEDKAASVPVPVSDIHELVRLCVPKLSKRYATIITLYYLQDTPYEEIARVMRIPLGTLKTWMYRARAELRKIVESELGT